MAMITLRVDDSARGEMERAARDRGMNISELLRAAVEKFLGGEDGQMSRSAAPLSLDMIERRTLGLLHEILEHLDDEDQASHHRELARVLREGFTAEYYKDFTDIESELTQAQCNLVHDILEMFQVLEHSLDRLDDDERAQLGENAEHGLRFGGFDMNHSLEHHMLSYIWYLVDTNRWTYFAERVAVENERGNSHMPMLAVYQRMLAVYKDVLDRKKAGRGSSIDAYRFTTTELREVLDALSYSR